MSLFRKEALSHRYETGWARLEARRTVGLFAGFAIAAANVLALVAVFMLTR